MKMRYFLRGRTTISTLVRGLPSPFEVPSVLPSPSLVCIFPELFLLLPFFSLFILYFLECIKYIFALFCVLLLPFIYAPYFLENMELLLVTKAYTLLKFVVFDQKKKKKDLKWGEGELFSTKMRTT
jgi:hypothetical protein